MNINSIISFVITLLEGARPEAAPFLEDIKSDIASGKPVTADEVKKAVDDAFSGAEVDIPKYKNSLEQTRILLDQAEITVAAWESDIAAANAKTTS